MWIPQFEVQVERARHRELERAPLALIARMDAREPVVRACSAEVRAAGIAPGDGSPRIAVRCPDAVLLPYDSRWYDHCYEELLAALDAVTPLIETQPLDAFYLDLSGLPQLSAHDPQGVAEAVRAVFPPHL